MIYKFSATVIGAMIALMIMINSLFAEQAGYLLSILVIHLVGVIAVSLVLLFRVEEKRSGVPFYLYLGGLVGVVLLFSNNYCFQVLGASLTLALGITGQATASLLTDSFGLLGMKKYPIQRHKLVALVVSMSGLVLMIEKWDFYLLTSAMAFGTGMLVLLTMILNSQLALRVGVFRGTRINYLSGLAATLAIIMLSEPGNVQPFAVLLTINPVLLFGGGLMGVAIVAAINVFLPKIPTIYSTLLIIVGQLLCGIAIDYFYSDTLSIRKLCGIGLVVAGAGLNLLLENRISKDDVGGTNTVRASPLFP